MPCPGTLLCVVETRHQGVGPRPCTNLMGCSAPQSALGYEPAMALVGHVVFVHVPYVSARASAMRMTSLLDHLTQRVARTPVHLVDSGLVSALRQLHERHQDLDGTVRHLRVTGAAPGRYALAELRVDLVAQWFIDAVRADRSCGPVWAPHHRR